MKHYAFHDPDGLVRFEATLQDDETPEPVDGAVPRELFEPLGPAPAGTRWVVTETNALIAQRIAVSFEDQRAAKLASLKAARDARVFAPFEWNGLVFDADQRSQTVILGLKVDSLEPTFTPQPYRLADNSWTVLTAADIDALWPALSAHVRAQFGIFAQLEAAALAATTPQELEGITWTP